MNYDAYLHQAALPDLERLARWLGLAVARKRFEPKIAYKRRVVHAIARCRKQGTKRAKVVAFDRTR